MGKGGGSTSFGKGSSKSKSTTRIPAYLQPLIYQGIDTGADTLGYLDRTINSGARDGTLTAGFTPAQIAAQQAGIARAQDPNGAFATSRQTILDAANGTNADEFINPSAVGSLEAMAQEGFGFLPEQTQRALAASAEAGALTGTDFLGDLANGSGIDPAIMEKLNSAGADAAGQAELQALAQGAASQNPIAREALEQTAAGDFLYGGAGFDAAVEAAVRAAQPGILSTFGRGGSGAATGALSQAAIGTAGVDAFANQYAAERGRQLNAANSLSSLDLQERGQTADILSRVGSLDLAGREQGLNAAQAAGGLSLQDRAQQGDAASLLAEFDLANRGQQLGAATTLGQFADSGANRELAASDLLASMGLQERQNQLNSAALLPNIANADIDMLNAIGAEQQELAQRGIDTPLNAQFQLLASALGATPTTALLENRNTTRNRSFLQTFYGEGSFGGGIGGGGG